MAIFLENSTENAVTSHSASPSPTSFPSSTRHPRDLFAPLRDLKPNHGLNRAAKLSRSVLPIKTGSESELRECEYQVSSILRPSISAVKDGLMSLYGRSVSHADRDVNMVVDITGKNSLE